MIMIEWNNREDFKRLMRALDGSGDVQSGKHLPTDADINGRYARQYSASRIPGPVEGQTLSFFASPRRRAGDYSTPVVCLVGAPWSDANARDAVYTFLADAGCACNDATAVEQATADRAVGK